MNLSIHIAHPNEVHTLQRELRVTFTMLLLLASCIVLTDVVNGQTALPQEVANREESGDMKIIRSLLLEENPEYARLSFGDALNPDAKWARGWESWWSPDRARFFVYKRHPMDERGYLYLDGSTNWLVHDLLSMKDICKQTTEGFNYGAYPTIYKEDFFLIGGYGHYRYNRNWLKYERRGAFGHATFENKANHVTEKYLSPPHVMQGMWRDNQKKCYFMLTNAWAFDEPNFPPPQTKLLTDSLRGGLRQFQLWQLPDSSDVNFIHLADFNDDVLGEEVPIAMVESESWVIVLRANTTSTPMMRKSDFAWFELKADHQLPFGGKTGLYGWMFRGDTLLVVNEGVVEQALDLNVHLDMYQSEQPQLVEARHDLLLKPFQLDFTKEIPVEGPPWGPPAAAAALAFLVLFILQRIKKGAAQNELNDMNVQLEIIEYFSRSIFRINSADDILKDIAAQCISRLDFEDCAIYMLDKDNNQWVQKAAYGPKNTGYRDIKNPSILGISEGIVGAVGLSGQAEIVPDLRKDTRYVVDDAERLSEMAVPIVCDGKVIGVIDSENSEADFFTRDHLKIIQNVANICGQKIGRTLSEQKTLEFIQVYEQNPDPVLRVNRQGLVLMNNDSAKSHFGRNALQGEKVKLPDLMGLIEESLSSGKSQVASIKNASRIYQVHILPQDNHAFVDVYATDVTDLERARTRAEKAERAKADFLSIMSHEIRTPLNAIMGLNELLLKDNLKDEHLKQLKYMQYSGKHLLGLVNNILNLESLDRGKVTRKVHNFNLTLLIEELAASFFARAKDQGTSLEVKSLSTEDAWVKGDRHWVTQMVSNLLDNAVKFTKRGSVTVTTTTLPGEDYWHIEFEDTGVGIAEEHLERIMDPFEQVLSNPKNTSPDQGTGLGLAIVKQLASLHGGELKVQSTEGIGSKFTLELELLTGSESNEENTEQAVDQDSNNSISDAKVLVVDDNPLNLLVAKKQIEKLGHHVVTATNGKEAIKSWISEEPEMIFMDLQMPVMDGMEATQEIRRRMKNNGSKILGIVALTADAEASTKKEALSSGLNDVLVKPASIDQLEMIIQHWCKEHREST